MQIELYVLTGKRRSVTDKKSIKKNYIYNLLFQMLTIAIPLISTPYVSRVLGVEGIGTISYTQNNISYLIMIGNFGLGLYATRQVAYCAEDPKRLRECFSNLIITKLLTFVPVLLIYTGIVIYSTEFRTFYLIELINIIDAIIDVSWYFNGQENFRITVARGSLVKIAGLLLIFCFVKEAEDIYLYILILGFSQFIGNTLLFIIAYRWQGLSLPQWQIVCDNVKGGAILFVPQMASSLYFYCDKILIKLLSTGTVENGYYEQSQKLIRLSTVIITALPTVMMPRIAAEFSKKNVDDISAYMKKSLNFVMLLGLPMTFGLIGISDPFVPWFFGDDFDKVRLLLKIMAPIILFNSIYNVIGYQYFIAVKKEKIFTCTILCGSAVNIILNIITIPQYGSAGAAAASTFAEIAIVAAQLIVILKSMKLKGVAKTAAKSLIGSALMMILILLTRDWYANAVVSTFASIVFGAVVYVIMMFVLKNVEFTNFVKTLMIRRKIDAGEG